MNWIVEQITATQQMGTHIDGLNHLQVGERVYNGLALADIVEDYATNRLGIETLPQIVTRGLLLDVARLRGARWLAPGEVITPADAEAALAGITVRPATRCSSGSTRQTRTTPQGWRHSMDFWLTTEDLPLPQNRVLVDRDGRITLHYTPTNLEARQRLRDRFTSLLDTMRCHEEVRENPHYLGGRLGISAVAHQNGTVRFGPDPHTSALDLHCRMHELDNVYVADSSFFVSSTAVNPTLTIIANALRVADHIAERLGASSRREAEPVGAGL